MPDLDHCLHCSPSNSAHLNAENVRHSPRSPSGDRDSRLHSGRGGRSDAGEGLREAAGRRPWQGLESEREGAQGEGRTLPGMQGLWLQGVSVLQGDVDDAGLLGR